MKLSQNFILALQSINNNRLRTLLTVLGVVVGIFSIIVIMTIITMLQSSIESGVSFLNKNSFEINKWPAVMTGDFSKYRNRKDITLEQYYRLEDIMLPKVKYMGAMQDHGPIVVKNGNKETNPNIWVSGVTLGAYHTYNVSIAEGRSMQSNDVEYSTNICILGAEVNEKIFPNMSGIGKTVRIDGHPMKVIGVFDKMPSFFGASQDNFVIIPLSTFQTFYGKHNNSLKISIMTNSKEDYNSTIEASIGHLRTIRKNKPWEDNDFDIFSNESIIGQINDITGGVKIGALAVSIIALIAAGVGIMNIMLVSVTERTREIGIRKAIGAKKMNILAQFLFEAIVLCVAGGFVGILLGVGLGNLVGLALNAQTAIPYDWVAIGLTLCVAVGVIFGTYPAYKAANLDPIEALRYE